MVNRVRRSLQLPIMVLFIAILSGIPQLASAQQATPVVEAPVATEEVASPETTVEATEVATPGAPIMEIAPMAAVGGVTDVSVREDTIAGTVAEVVVDFSFTVPAGASVGDTITIQAVPGDLTFLPAAFPLFYTDPLTGNNTTDVIANLTVTPSGGIVLTLTQFAVENQDVSGSGWVQAALRRPSCSGSPTTHNVVFDTSNTSGQIQWTDTIERALCVPGTGMAKSGTLVTYQGEKHISWSIGKDYPIGGDVSFSDTLGAGLEVVCSTIQLATATAALGVTLTVDSCDPEIGFNFTLHNTIAGQGAGINYITRRTDAGPDYTNCVSRTAPTQSPEMCRTVTVTEGGGGTGVILPPRAVTPVTPAAPVAACVSGTVTPPVLTLPADDDTITYAMRAGDPIESATQYEFQVTATIIKTNRIFTQDSLGAGWTLVDATHATYTETVAKPDCLVTPVAPTTQPSVCSDTGASDPAITLPADTAEVTYIASDPVIDGDSYTFTVTATLVDSAAHAFDSASMGEWVDNGDGTATWTTTLTKIECPATPAMPVIEQSTCVDGVATVPGLTVPANTAAVTYVGRADDPMVDGPTYSYQITATLAEGFVWDDANMGDWVVQEDGTAIYERTLTSRLCDVPQEPIAPAVPVVTESVCTDGVAADPAITLATGNGEITYSGADAPQIDGNAYSYHLVAIPEIGYYLDDTAMGDWVMQEDGSAVYDLTLTKVMCDETPEPTTPVETPTATEPVAPVTTPEPTTPAVPVPTGTPAATEPSVPASGTPTTSVSETPAAVTNLPKTGSGETFSAALGGVAMMAVVSAIALVGYGLIQHRKKQ